MAGLGEGDDRELWRRWSAGGSVAAPAPHALELAAYAEGRLSETAAERVELWLAAHPETLNAVLEDLSAARGATLATAAVADAALIARASALVTGARGNVVPLHRTTPAWRNALAWSSIAASLIVASLGGFAMGSDAYQHLTRPQATDTASGDTLDVTATLESAFGDDSGT